jgi:hypothetical protein
MGLWVLEQLGLLRFRNHNQKSSHGTPCGD